MEENNEKNKKYEANLMKASNSYRKLRKSIQKTTLRIIRIARFIWPFIINPFFLIIFLFILFIGGIYMLVTDSGKNISLQSTPSIIISKEKALALGLEIYEEGEYKGKIKGCEKLELPENIYTSFIKGYSEQVFNSDAQMINNLCLYHLLYLKKIKGELSFEKESESIDEIKGKLEKGSNLKKEEINKLKKEKNELEEKVNLAQETLATLDLPYVGEDKFKNYENEEYGFKSYVDYPISYFEEKKIEFLDMLYLNHIGSTYGEAYSGGISMGGGLFGLLDEQKYYNILNELGTEYNKDNIATDFLNGKFGLPNFIEDINDGGEYYHYNCEPCKSKDGCSCTGDPEEDYNKNFQDDNLGLSYFRGYINFVKSLSDKKVIYVSNNVKSPFRDYLQSGKSCSVTINLMQRDGPSNLSFGFFKGYPKVNGVRTHAGLDLACSDSCNGKNVPVFSITDGVVVLKTYSTTSWGNSIIIKTLINDEEYYLRYSHLKDLPNLLVGDVVSVDTFIGIQGTSGPSTGKHLDLTVYKGGVKYEDYLRDTLNWGGVFNFSFIDMMQTGFSDYTIGSLNTSNCYNCGN